MFVQQLNLRTCTDSCRALFQIINHIQSGGDLRDAPADADDEASVMQSVTSHTSDVDGGSAHLSQSPQLPQECFDSVKQMVDEAINDTFEEEGRPVTSPAPEVDSGACHIFMYIRHSLMT